MCTICAYNNLVMDFEWDARKAESNLKKHGIDFADAVFVLEDPNAITIDDENEQEQRFVSIGIDCFARVLVVVYTWRRNNVRIISARKATGKERRQYEVGP